MVRVDDKGQLEFAKPEPASRRSRAVTPATRNPLVLEYGRNLMALRAALTSADQVERGRGARLERGHQAAAGGQRAGHRAARPSVLRLASAKAAPRSAAAPA